MVKVTVKKIMIVVYDWSKFGKVKFRFMACRWDIRGFI